jgi:hypothetical protein
MKKTLNITIGGRVFAIEEDAYERLNLYLEQVKNIFNKYGIKKESEETFIVYNKDFDYTKYELFVHCM